VLRPGGVLVDYHRPDWWHPLRYLFGPVMRTLEPFARDLWDSDMAAWLPEDPGSATQVRHYFFGRLDQMLTLTRSAASITSTGLTRSRANLHEPLLHRRNEVAAPVTRRSPAAARQKRLGSGPGRYYFFRRLDQMLTLTRPAASITSTGLTRSRANLHEPLLFVSSMRRH
jgi:hypothetical protein